MKTHSENCQKLTICDRKCQAIADYQANSFSITEFCAAVGISTRQYYRLKRAGIGPRETRQLGVISIQKHAIDQYLYEHTGR